MTTQQQALEHALFWVRTSTNTRKVTFTYERHWADTSKVTVSIYAYDSVKGQGAVLPKLFMGDISKYLCQLEQESLHDSITDMKKILTKLETEGCSDD